MAEESRLFCLKDVGLWRRGEKVCEVRRVASVGEKGLWCHLVFERARKLGMETDNGEVFAEVGRRLMKEL